MTKFEHYVTFVMTFLWFLIKIRQTWNSKLRKNSDWSKKNSLTNKKFVSPVFSNFVIFQNWLMKCQRPWLQKAPSKFEIRELNSLFMIWNLLTYYMSGDLNFPATVSWLAWSFPRFKRQPYIFHRCYQKSQHLLDWLFYFPKTR